jgi:hypothetical protein
VATSAFLADPNSIVDASSQLGVSGQVNIQQPINNLKGTLAVLPGETLEVANLLQSSCIARLRGEQMSSLIQRGRDEAPAGPGEPMQFPIFASAAPAPSAVEGSLVSRETSFAGMNSSETLHASRFTRYGLSGFGGELQIRGLSRLLAGLGSGGSCDAA